MTDIAIILTPREQEAIAIVCDLALKHAGNNALQTVLAVHQAMNKAQVAPPNAERKVEHSAQ